MTASVHYSDDAVTLWHGDARRVSEFIAAESVDLLVTSPPYFALRSYTDDGEHYDGQMGSVQLTLEGGDVMDDHVFHHAGGPADCRFCQQYTRPVGTVVLDGGFDEISRLAAIGGLDEVRGPAADGAEDEGRAASRLPPCAVVLPAEAPGPFADRRQVTRDAAASTVHEDGAA